jgi:nitrate reductase gamma subunit
MHQIYHFVTGPLVWVSLILFFGGCIWRLVHLIATVREKEPFIFSYMSLRYSLRSIAHWITPFATENWKRHPWLTLVTFAFHICLIVTPIFLLSHVVLWEEAWNISWWTLPDAMADVMTLVVVGGCVFFLFRRRVLPEVRFVTDASDFVILAIVAAPFVTGFLAYHQWFAYPTLMILPVLAGEIMLVAIPFTRLSHMLFSPLTRAYMGSEFGKVRHAKDW